MTIPIHTTGQVISATGVDRTIALFRNSILQFPSGTASSLEGQVGAGQLTTELQDVLVALIGNSGGLGSYSISHNDISAIAEGPSTIVMLGRQEAATGAATGIREVFAVDAITLAPVGTPVIVDSISTSERDYPDMIKCGNYVWAIGATTGLNKVTKINVDTLASTGFTLGVDTAATVIAVATDNSYIYAFTKHSTMYYPNSFIKVAQDGTAVGMIYSGLATTGKVRLCVSNNGYLYASFDDSSVKQVRKYDTSPLNGLKEIWSVAGGDFLDTPTMMCAVDSYVYVLNGLYLHRLSTVTDETELIHTYTTAPDRIYYDGTTLWVAMDDELYKCSKLGDILQTTIPSTGQNIQAIRKSFGFLWNTFVSETTSENIVKSYPGLPV